MCSANYQIPEINKRNKVSFILNEAILKIFKLRYWSKTILKMCVAIIGGAKQLQVITFPQVPPAVLVNMATKNNTDSKETKDKKEKETIEKKVRNSYGFLSLRKFSQLNRSPKSENNNTCQTIYLIHKHRK